MSIDDVRRRIDGVDAKILELLEERAGLAAQAGAEKRANEQALYDPEREQRVFERLEALHDARGDASFPRASLRPVFREIISACLSLEQPIGVAYLGPPGTFTHMAARSVFGMSPRYLEAATIPGVFDAVARGTAEYGVVPIENSTEGGVTFTLDSLLESDAMIRSEAVLDVAQCLVGRHDELGRIQRVYSHPQALAQCRGWLAKNLPHAQLVVSPSTSAAAREAAGDDGAAAVASRLAAELSGLEVIREGIQDRARNATRFVVIAPTDAPPTGRDRTSVVFSAPHERGALKRILEIFEAEDLNLTRIESRPAPDKLWEYVFFTDFEGHRSEPKVARALDRLRGECAMVRVLGSYPRAGSRP
jgi:chorismate mutase / prephenate dehydratase